MECTFFYELRLYIIWYQIETVHLYKRDFIVEKYLHVVLWNISNIPLPFYATQIINIFLNSSITANHDKVDWLSANGEIFIKGIVSLL